MYGDDDDDDDGGGGSDGVVMPRKVEGSLMLSRISASVVRFCNSRRNAFVLPM
jgi:hypothetical protein